MRKKYISLIGILLTFSMVSCGGTSSSINYYPEEHETYLYTNPVFSGDGADPTIIRAHDGYFYVYSTAEWHTWIPGEESFFSVGPILRSSNLTEWEYVGEVFPNGVPDWSEVINASVWAPDVIYRNGLYYYYYSISQMQREVGKEGIGVATSPSPTGPFTDHGKLFTGEEFGIPNCIDPCVREDEDGKLYMIFGSYGGSINAVELSEDGLSVKYPNEPYFNRTHLAADELLGGTLEGAYSIKMYGSYYLFVSCGNFNTYTTKVFKSDKLLGPYVDDKGRKATSNSSGTVVVTESSVAYGTGHNSVIEDDDGVFWIVYHAFNKENPIARELCIDKLRFTEDGFPKLPNESSTMGNPTKAPYVANN